MVTHHKKGFTLIELVITMTIASIIAMVTAQLISRPVTAYANLSLRAQLVDSAESSLERMTREIRTALPNSIRIGCSGKCIEFLRTVDGGRYRLSAPGNALDFDQSSHDADGFEVLGDLYDPTSITTSNDPDHCRIGNANCLVIYNTGQANHNAYDLDNIATIENISGTPSVIEFSFSGGQLAFPTSSPAQRFSIVDTPISFVCDTVNNTITRYQGYPITADHNDVDAELVGLSGINKALVTDKIDTCSFIYNSGSTNRSGLITISLKLSETMPSGHTENINLLQQVHVPNTP